MNFYPSMHYLVLLCLVAMAATHELIFDDEDFEDDDDYEKKPVPVAKNPIRYNAKFVQDREHLKEHMGTVKMDIDKESDRGVEFHFFNSHDTDQDGRLDGLELYHSMEHNIESQVETIENNEKLKEGTRKWKIQRLYTQITGTVDKILDDDDWNNDGYLSYTEFINARQGGVFHSVVTGSR